MPKRTARRKSFLKFAKRKSPALCGSGDTLQVGAGLLYRINKKGPFLLILSILLIL